MLTAFKKLLSLITDLQRMERVHRAIVWLIQIAIFALSGLAAFLLRFDLSIPPYYVPYLKLGLIVWIVVKAIVFRARRLDRRWWRYVSTDDVVQMAIANAIGSAASTVVIHLISPVGFPRSIYLIDLLICFLATTGIRLSARIVADAMIRHDRKGPGKRVLVYGAGMAGVMLLRDIRTNPTLNYEAVGFIDDNANKKGANIQSIPVLGCGADLKNILRTRSVEEVLIAIPSATGAEMTKIIFYCREAEVPCRTIPAIAEIIKSRALASQIRDVAVEDLLGRSPVVLGEFEISAKLRDKVVMVTGAAGSIASELCRQIARFEPRAIVGYEISETALFYLEREMQRAFPGVPFYPEIGNIQNYQRLLEVMETHRPSVVYHAAAYKHVPMMEAHVIEAVHNNVFGTYQVALAASRCGVADFVMISSDKAVHPTNVMGATKRVAELLINSLQNGGTKFVSVRFGNVLGSTGSVIPIFKAQIAAGGPVTVTDPEMRRYFMTIPEAAQLVLQASTMGRGGEIFVLDMGDPVKIADLARNLILLSGFQPGEDIKIEFTGIRPGEKLYEELSTSSEDTVPTSHPKIKVFRHRGLSAEEMMRAIDCLQDLCGSRDLQALVLKIKEIVPEYTPSVHVLRRITEKKTRAVAQ